MCSFRSLAAQDLRDVLVVLEEHNIDDEAVCFSHRRRSYLRVGVLQPGEGGDENQRVRMCVRAHALVHLCDLCVHAHMRAGVQSRVHTKFCVSVSAHVRMHRHTSQASQQPVRLLPAIK